MFFHIEKTFDVKALNDYISSMSDLQTEDFLYDTDVEKSKIAKNSFNIPTGDFFYEPWEIKPEYKGTPLDMCLQELGPVGEARLVTLDAGTCYYRHADIDDRYHITLTGDNAYLMDVENDLIYRTSVDNKFYLLDAGTIHSAVNVGPNKRLQLVVRKLLNNNTLVDSVKVKLQLTGDLDWSRYLFDNYFSSWLNKQNKKGTINNFKTDGRFFAEFDLEKKRLKEFTDICDIIDYDFKVTIDDRHYQKNI